MVVEIGSEDRIGGIVVPGEIICQAKLERVAAVDLQHRARKAGRVRFAVGVELVGHGVRVVVTVLIREAAVDFSPADEDRIGVEACRDHPDVGLEHAVLALDHIHRPQFCLLGCIFGRENNVFCRHHRPLLELLEVELPLVPAGPTVGMLAGGKSRSKPGVATHCESLFRKNRENKSSTLTAELSLRFRHGKFFACYFLRRGREGPFSRKKAVSLWDHPPPPSAIRPPK